MKISIYKLLGMIKDGKAPKKIKYENREYYLYDNKSYLTTDKTRFFDRIYFSDLNIEVEIIEEKKIPEKFKVHSLGDKDENGNFVNSPFPTDEEFMNKINDIINYLIYLKSKGE